MDLLKQVEQVLRIIYTYIYILYLRYKLVYNVSPTPTDMFIVYIPEARRRSLRRRGPRESAQTGGAGAETYMYVSMYTGL